METAMKIIEKNGYAFIKEKNFSNYYDKRVEKG
jgi:hypothetical protein